MDEAIIWGRTLDDIRPARCPRTFEGVRLRGSLVDALRTLACQRKSYSVFFYLFLSWASFYRKMEKWNSQKPLLSGLFHLCNWILSFFGNNCFSLYLTKYFYHSNQMTFIFQGFLNKWQYAAGDVSKETKRAKSRLCYYVEPNKTLTTQCNVDLCAGQQILRNHV